MKNINHGPGRSGSPAVWLVLLLQGLGESVALVRCRVAEVWQERQRFRRP
jgi:hypothetical protein